MITTFWFHCTNLWEATTFCLLCKDTGKCLHPFVNANNLLLCLSHQSLQSSNLFFTVQWQQQCLYLSWLMPRTFCFICHVNHCEATIFSLLWKQQQWCVYVSFSLPKNLCFHHSHQWEATTFCLLCNNSDNVSTSLPPNQNLKASSAPQSMRSNNLSLLQQWQQCVYLPSSMPKNLQLCLPPQWTRNNYLFLLCNDCNNVSTSLPPYQKPSVSTTPIDEKQLLFCLLHNNRWCVELPFCFVCCINWQVATTFSLLYNDTDNMSTSFCWC